MIRSGAKPTPLDKRDRSFHLSYGALPSVFEESFNVDVGLSMPNQDEEGLPFGCTGETQTDNQADEDILLYDAGYTYGRTCFIEGHPETSGCDVRTSLKSTQVYGFRKKGDAVTVLPEPRKGGGYYNIYDDGGLCWFDGIRSAIKKEKKGVSIGSPWFPSWGYGRIASDGIMWMPTFSELEGVKNNPYAVSWHNYACKGWVTIKGVPYLKIKSWQGKLIGDGGWLYMSREVANTVLEIKGSVVFIQTKSKPGDIITIKLSTLEVLISYLYRLIGLMRLN